VRPPDPTFLWDLAALTATAHHQEIELTRSGAMPKRAAQRLIAEGGVKVDGSPVTDPAARWPAEGPAVLQVGARKFVRITP